MSDISQIIHIILLLKCKKRTHIGGIFGTGETFFSVALFSEREQPSLHGCDIIAFQMQPSKAALGTEQLIKICIVDEFNIAVILF